MAAMVKLNLAIYLYEKKSSPNAYKDSTSPVIKALYTSENVPVINNLYQRHCEMLFFDSKISYFLYFICRQTTHLFAGKDITKVSTAAIRAKYFCASFLQSVKNKA